MRVDCDQDALWLKVKVAGDGGCCHTGRRSCFYRKVETSGGEPRLVID
jgi:phosphoribosyl-AMP cyclohydrolase